MHVVETTSRAFTVTHVIPGDAPVSGVTSLGDEVFVMRYDESQQVEVYDAMSFTLQRRLSVPGLGLSYGLAACASNKCLYAYDFDDNCVHRVKLSGSNAVIKWSVKEWPTGLTVNKAKNVLIMSKSEPKLQQFSTHGTLLQTFQLQSDIECPRGVAELSSGQFVICNAGQDHCVCLLDDKGAVVRKYGSTPGSELTKMKLPVGLAVDRHDNILVADSGNNRLLVLDRSLTSAHEMSVSVDGGQLGDPVSLWYDKSRDRLYIGEDKGHRVIIIDNLKNFTTSATAR